MLDEEKVKWPSKKKYTCKRNKGEHEYLKPIITHAPAIRYIYKLPSNSILESSTLHPEFKHMRTEITLGVQAVCKHCGKVIFKFFRE